MVFEQMLHCYAHFNMIVDHTIQATNKLNLSFWSQVEEVHLPAPPAASQGGVQAELPDGGVPAPRPPGSRPHPAPPEGHGPQAASGAAGPSQLRGEGGLRQRGGG